MSWKRQAALFLFLSCAPVTSLFAADGSSGCGPGWYVLKDNSILSSSLRSTTNYILWPVVTLGMTFGTSNCAKHSLVLKDKESLHLVTHARHELERQIAQGQGEQLGALALTFGCNAEAYPEFKTALKEQFNVVMPSATASAEEIVNNIHMTILSQPNLAAQCRTDLG